jgi:hypothetical protein
LRQLPARWWQAAISLELMNTTVSDNYAAPTRSGGIIIMAADLSGVCQRCGAADADGGFVHGQPSRDPIFQSTPPISLIRGLRHHSLIEKIV